MLGPNGNPITASDDSDNGTDPSGENGEDDLDGVAGNDPTPVVIADLAIAKTITGEPVLRNDGIFVVTFEVEVENTGTVDLSDLSLLEDLSSQFGSCLLYTSPSPRDATLSRMPSSA